MSKKTTKRALAMSFVSVFLCVCMLVGTTFAWFTDSVTSSNNIIKSGTLDVTMEWKDATANGTQTTYKDASTGAIFNNDKWEPGYVEAKNIKIENKGTLALKYKLDIFANGTVSDLANVIDVYYGDGEHTLASREMTELTHLGTLTEVLANMRTAGSTAYGELAAGDSHIVTLALKMPESVGNEYQGKSIGSEFAVKLIATQLEAELDSFDNTYDEGAAWSGVIPATQPASLVLEFADTYQGGGKVIIKDADAFVYMNKLVEYFKDIATYPPNEYYYNLAWSVELDADLNLMNIPVDTIDMGFFGGFDGKGHTISNVVLKDGEGALFNNGTIKNLNVKNIVVNAPNTQYVGAITSKNGAFNNVHVDNATVNGSKYVGGIAGKASYMINSSITNSIITATDKTVGGMVGYFIMDGGSTVTVTGNKVDTVTVTGAYNVGGMLGQAQNVTVEGNTVKDVTVKSTTALPGIADATEVRSAGVAARSAFTTTTIGTNTVENVTLVNQ